MDILDHIADYICAELGDDIFTDDRRADFLLNFRTNYGKDRHYIASAAAHRETEQIEKIFAAFRAGLGSREIAERIGISQRTVQRVIARHPMP